jgi:UDP-N-acetylglucosamine 2-epimerase (non-hydrolysing)
MQSDQSLADFAARCLSSLHATLNTLRPDAILVQGDTTTVAIASLAGFYAGVSVGHVEAGLRSLDRRNPFPEEVNRRITSCLANLHFAPTERARDNLLREGIPPEEIFVTGNTIVDALESIVLGDHFEDETLNNLHFTSKRILLVTAHRRENHGAPLNAICAAIKCLARQFESVDIVYPVHLNPNVNSIVRSELGQIPNVHLLHPISYHDMLRLMARCYLILTDSGGVQEEAPSFHKPVLVLRNLTERPELIEVGAGRLVGSDPARIVSETTKLLTDANEYRLMSTADNPFGDGHAAERIVTILAQRL